MMVMVGARGRQRDDYAAAPGQRRTRGWRGANVIGISGCKNSGGDCAALGARTGQRRHSCLQRRRRLATVQRRVGTTGVNGGEGGRRQIDR